ncbi:class I adenylate-forming enzyme family protein [Pseudaestuariivita atlantica]|uniref:AMP-dependent synthetase n=1 Tax=Pseudaestuariivita atlantica TaxID=1317121 RepID=A0A0L1JM02_9RHOB|nr:AMP-binding protein [Pseudaestuariivita atlantica]KNG92752.1 hypothetical protein ATO11_14845 [Pseudaestuariivita atlantica]
MRTALDDLARWAREAPDRPAVAEGARVFADYATLARRVAGLAAAMDARGIGAGDRVALLSRNAPRYFEALLAIWSCGAAAVPVNARLAEAETSWILTHADVSLVCAGPDLAAQAGASGREVITLGGEAWEEAASSGTDFAARAVAADDLAWLFYTSGTTGRPKGAMITHRNLDAMCRGYLASVDPEPPWAAILHPSPLSHGSGLYALVHLRQGAVQVVPGSGGFDPAEMAGLLRDWPGAVFFAAPTILRRLVAAGVDLSPLKAAIYGGAPMPVADVRAFLGAYGPKLAQLYGQGEAPMTLTALTRQQMAEGDAALLESAGFAQAGVEIAVLGPDGTPVPQGERGEVAARGDIVCAGYWRDEAATGATFGGGWLRTGDVGWLREDGLLTLVDRSKDLIISGGYNIYPREIEEVLARHEGVMEAAVISRPHDDYGEEVVAYVVGSADAAVLEAHCLAHLARYKRPRAWRFVEALPRNAYGKVLKTELRDREHK